MFVVPVTFKNGTTYDVFVFGTLSILPSTDKKSPFRGSVCTGQLGRYVSRNSRTMAELLNDVFRDIQRDIGADLTAFLYRTYFNHIEIDFGAIQQVIIEAFEQTMKPTAISDETWDEFLNTLLIGIEVAINTTWYVPHFWDQEIEDEDEMMGCVMTMMRAVFAVVTRTQGDTMLREMEGSNLPRLDQENATGHR